MSEVCGALVILLLTGKGDRSGSLKTRARLETNLYLIPSLPFPSLNSFPMTTPQLPFLFTKLGFTYLYIVPPFSVNAVALLIYG